MKGAEWIKMKTSMCEDETMRLMDSMNYRDTTFYVWIRLLLQAGKVNDNGLIYLKKDVPYTKEMISILFNRPIDIIEKVLDILESFKMIKIYENHIIKICNWEKHQNIEGMKKIREGTNERVKNFREKKKKENEDLEKKNINNVEANRNNTDEINKNKNCNGNVTLQREKREEDKKNEKKNIDIKEREEEEDEELEVQGLDFIKSLEKINVSINGLTLRALKDMLANHKEEYVKMAIGKAIEKNKLDTNYINGILKNWIREGYPKTYEEMEFNNNTNNNLASPKEKPKLRFINFESRQYDYDDLEKKLLGWK